MPFATTYGTDQLHLGDNTMLVGTAMLGNAFGQIESATVSREAEVQEIEAAGGNLRAVVLKNIRFELDMEVIFDASVTAPGLFDLITLPFAGVQGRVMPGASVKWSKGKERLLSFKATSWDALSGAVAYSYNPVSGLFTAL
jgi:hypothetical protein